MRYTHEPNVASPRNRVECVVDAHHDLLRDVFRFGRESLPEDRHRETEDRVVVAKSRQLRECRFVSRRATALDQATRRRRCGTIPGVNVSAVRQGRTSRQSGRHRAGRSAREVATVRVGGPIRPTRNRAAMVPTPSVAQTRPWISVSRGSGAFGTLGGSIASSGRGMPLSIAATRSWWMTSRRRCRSRCLKYR